MLVKIKVAEEKTDGGILLPTSAQTKPQGGEVVAVGEGKTIGKTKLDISIKVIFYGFLTYSYLFAFCCTLQFHLHGICFCMCRLAPR